MLSVGAVLCKVAQFPTVKTGIIGGMRLVGIGGSSLEVLVSSPAPPLVSSPVPIRIRPAEVHGYWLVIHARWGVGCVILWTLPGIVQVVSPIEKRVSGLVIGWSQRV